AGGLASAIMLRRDVEGDAGGGASRRIKAQWVTPRFLTVLGVRPLAGTDFNAESARFGVPASTAIASWAFWQRELGGDPHVVGRVVRIAGRPVTIRAIAPRGFACIDLDGADLWLPLGGFTGFRDRPGARPGSRGAPTARARRRGTRAGPRSRSEFSRGRRLVARSNN